MTKGQTGVEERLWTIPVTVVFPSGMFGASSIKNSCSDSRMEVKLPDLLGNYDRPTDQPTDGQIGSKGSYNPISMK